MSTPTLGGSVRDRDTSRNATQSRDVRRLFYALMDIDPVTRRAILMESSAREREVLFGIAENLGGTPYCLWADDPVGFVEDVLGENLWSTTRALFTGLTTHQRVAVPSSFSTGKTHSSSRAVLWWSAVHPVGTTVTVTLAPLWRQVERIIWPEIRNAHRRTSMPGTVDMTQMKMMSRSGVDTVVAYGIAASPTNEAAVQGIHAPNVLIVVDEAGGLSHNIGRNLRGLLTGPNSRLLAIGNPPTDDEGSWFEQLCDTDNVLTLPIPATSTPAFTGEAVGLCGSCPVEIPAHPITQHLVDRDWVDEVRDDYGEDSPYFQAKVLARFPKGGSDRVIPVSWIENAVEVEEPDEADGYIALRDLGLDDETSTLMVRPKAWVRLGVDVAADGGDEFVIARLVGDLATVEHNSSGATNANSVDVAGKVLVEIKRADALRKRLGTEAKVRVKIDGIGVGWGVASELIKWGEEGIHDAEIIPVIVSEGIDRDDDDQPMRPHNKRAEMWLAMRALLQPRKDKDPKRYGGSALRLRIDRRTAAQLATPGKATTSTGKTTIETKAAMKKRGMHSPDRAEAVLLAAYEPAPPKPKRRKARLIGA